MEGHMSNIVLGGVDISQIRAQRAAMRKDAVKFISDGIEEATKQFNELMLLEEGEEAEAEALAARINDILENVEVVADVSGVSYKLPYSDDGYYDERPFSYRLEDPEDEGGAVNAYGSKIMGKLLDTLQEMEVQCRDWYSSRC
jgi:hypothetical protein